MVSTFARYAVALFAAYIFAWTASCVFVFVSRGDGLDFRYYVEYFALAWTFRGFELPSFIWLFSVAAFVPLALGIIIVMRRRGRTRSLLSQGASDEITPTI